MSQLSFHNNEPIKAPPPHRNLPIIQHLLKAYQNWYSFLPHFPKTSRYTLGEKIDSLFIDILELVFSATYLSREQKLPFVQKAINKLNLINFFLQIAWEIKSLDNKRYIALSEHLAEIGKMLGGWNRQISK